MEQDFSEETLQYLREYRTHLFQAKHCFLLFWARPLIFYGLHQDAPALGSAQVANLSSSPGFFSKSGSKKYRSANKV